MRVLLSAFEPYDQWDQNSSWEALLEYLKTYGTTAELVTRRYPVDLTRLQERLAKDLESGFDVVMHMGQAPGISQIHLEAIALNVAGMTHAIGDDFDPLVDQGPIAFRTELPLGDLVSRLRGEGVLASISYHAGTYLCNAAMYLTHYWHYQRGRRAKIGFLHLPLTSQQVLTSGRSLPCMSTSETSRAIGILLNAIRENRIDAEVA